MELLTAKQIREITFEPAKRGHYDDDDVDNFVDQCAHTVETLQAKIDELNGKMEVLADKLMEYRNEEDSIRTALLNAQRMGDSIVREAKQKADLMLEDAKIKAEKIHETARREIGDEELELQRLRQEVAAFKNQMLDIYRRHLSLIDLLPEEETVPEEQLEAVEETVEPTAPLMEETVVEEAPVAEEVTEEPAAQIEELQEPLFDEPVEEEAPLLESLWQPDESLADVDDDETDDTSASRFSDLKFGKDYEVNGPFRRRK